MHFVTGKLAALPLPHGGSDRVDSTLEAIPKEASGKPRVLDRHHDDFSLLIALTIHLFRL
jgi:hypothetical protein